MFISSTNLEGEFMNKFRKWIDDEGGPKVVASNLRLNYRTVYFWLEGINSPTARLMVDLVKAGKGAFTYQDIIHCTVLKK
jgi:hypothetical protein